LNVAAGTWREFDSGYPRPGSRQDGYRLDNQRCERRLERNQATTYQNYTASRWESAASDPQTIMWTLALP